MKSPFLRKVSEEIFALHPQNLHSLCFVVPSKRSILFLKNHLQQVYSKEILLPEFLTIEEFASTLTEINLADPTDLLFNFYDAYIQVYGENAEEFDAFNRWALTLLKDFNDIDAHALDEKDFFKYIIHYFTIQQWDPSGNELTDFQKRYLHFWETIPQLYQALKLKMTQESYGYRGHIFKVLADKIQHNDDLVFLKAKKWNKIYFVGFNALTDSETQIIEQFCKQDISKVFLDADEYYLNNHEHEAGLFLRKLLQKDIWKNNAFVYNQKQFLNNKDIFLHPSSGVISQVKSIGSEILLKDIDLKNTAIVLADENMLLPLLNSLPKSISNINITLGYPLKNTYLYQVFVSYFEMQWFKHKERYWYYKQVISFLKSIQSYVQDSDKSIIKTILHRITAENMVRLYPMFFQEYSFSDGILKNSFSKNLSNPLTELPLLMQDIEHIKSNIDATPEGIIKSIDLETLFQFEKIIQQILWYAQKYSFSNDWKIITRLFEQMARNKTLPFIGEPLGGLQVMGMLETRLLDFKNIYLVSANEGILPKDSFENSFIPFEIKRYFKLHTYLEKDAIFSYHFYRLLQYPEHTHIYYNINASDEQGKSEPSRYLVQLKYELNKYNAKANIQEITEPEVDFSAGIGKPLILEKNDQILSHIKSYLQKGISFTAFNTFLACPLDFYNKYVLGIREEKEVEEDMEDNTLGSIIHHVLEKLYTPYIGQVLKISDFDTMLQKLEQQIVLSCEQHQQNITSEHGKAYLHVALIQEVVSRFLYVEKQFISELTHDYVVDSLEFKTEKTLLIQNIPVKFYGVIDRIDRVGDLYRLIDYKTGYYNASDTKLKHMEDLWSENVHKKSKAIQLLFYLFLLEDEKPFVQKQAGIFYLKKLSEGLVSLQISKSSEYLPEWILTFEEFLQQHISNMLNPNIPLSHKETSSYCLLCEG